MRLRLFYLTFSLFSKRPLPKSVRGHSGVLQAQSTDPGLTWSLAKKKTISKRDICTRFILPAVKQAGWDEMTQIREEVSFTKGRIIVRGKMVTRGKPKRAT
jgi:hypothetical protein